MGLDDVYAPIRSTILTIEPLPTIKEAFSLMSMDESHRTMHYKGFGVRGSTTTFISRPIDNRGSNTSFVPRLGHPADQVLSVLKDKIDLKGFQSSEPSEVCHRAKQTSDPFLVGIPLNMWYECVLAAVNLINRLSSVVLSGKCPYIVVESASADPTSTTDPYASTSNKGANSLDASNHELNITDKLGSVNAEGGVDDDGATLYDDDNISEGEGLDLYNLHLLLQENDNEDRTKEGSTLGLLLIYLKVEGLLARKYSLELLSEFGMLACKPSKIPLYVSKNKNKLVKLVDGDEKFLDNVTGYQKLVGKLIYLTITRSDISYVVHKLSQVMHAPKLADMKSDFKVLRYIKHSPGTSIQYSKSDKFHVSAFVDSDWAKCTATRKSVTGYAVYLRDNLVS
uniref:Uncharacterized protein n=1 Tax=Tanacetum cinerariifolium TaxID=118510 RepID=A0A699HY33_TANCI|nr:hypothetical protein [Tanacetum cinerariifolium]